MEREALYYAGLKMYNEGKYKETITFLQTNRNGINFHDFEKIHILFGRCYQKIGQSQYAIQEFESALKINPDSAPALIDIAGTHEDIENYQKALEYIEKVVILHPRLKETHYMKGRILRDLRKFPEALASYEIALKINPNDYYTCLNMGEIYFQLGQFDKALEYTDNAIRSSGGRTEAIINKAVWLFYLGKMEEAEKTIEKGIEINNQDEFLWYNKAMIAQFKGRLNDSLSYYQNALKINPNSIPSLNNQALVFLQTEQFQQTIKNFETALKLQPNDPLLWNNKGCGFFAIRQFGKAIECFEKAISISPTAPTTPTPYLNLANAYIESSKSTLQRAQTLFQNLNMPDNVNILEEVIRNLPPAKGIPINNFAIKYFSDKLQKILNILQNLDTGAPDTSNFIRERLYERISLINSFDLSLFGNFCDILSYLVNRLHVDADYREQIRKSADEFWKNHQDDNQLDMEKQWFQPELAGIIRKNYGTRVIREPDMVLGKPDFLLFEIPIELKVFNDKKNAGQQNKTGLDLLNAEVMQAMQYLMHNRIGFQIGYDYRQQVVQKEGRIEAIAERIKFKTIGEKLLCQIVFLGNIMTPTQCKALK